jgi:serine/threonine protein kinase
MTAQKQLESLAEQICDGDDVAWADEDNAVVKNLKVLQRLSETLRDQETDDEVERLLHVLNQSFDSWQSERSNKDAPDDPTTWGPLNIVSRLGSGAYADVYRAHDPALQRDVALKLFRSRDTDQQQRLLDEGRLLARLKHSNIVQVFGAEQHEGRIGLWMELIEGQTLADIVDANGPMSSAEAAEIGSQLCSALSAIHNEGLLFRDLKAQNVMREQGGAIKLMDFGAGMDSDESTAGRIAGTPFYLAPELFDDVAPSVQSDIYSLGVLLYHLTSGRFPLEADTVDELQEAHAGGHRLLRDARADLPGTFVECVEKAISKQADERYATSGEFATALSGQTAGTPTKSRRWILAAAAAAIAVWLLPQIYDTAPPQFQIDAKLTRIESDGSRTGLVSGDEVSVGDQLQLLLTPSDDIHLYVFNEDQAGNAWALYPLQALGQNNPLLGKQTHTLPGGDDGSLSWTVDSDGIIETIHIVASATADPRMAESFARLPEPQQAGFESRGLGQISRTVAQQAVSAESMVQLARELSGTAEEQSGAWYDVIELRNFGE